MADWKYTLYLRDIKGDGAVSYDKAGAIVARIRESAWYKAEMELGNSQLADAVEELADVDNAEWFAHVMSAIYDEADYRHSCFIDTVSPVPSWVVTR